MPDSFLALFDGTGFLVQEIGGVFGILVIWDRRGKMHDMFSNKHIFIKIKFFRHVNATDH